MSSASRVATAVAAGYVLGRFHKLKFAFIVGSALANKKVRGSAFALLQQGSDRMRSSPEVSGLGEQITGQLVDAGKSAALAAASSRMDALSDRLAERSESLRGPSTDDEPEGYDEDRDEPADTDEFEDEDDQRRDDEPDDEYGDEPDDEYDDDLGPDDEDEQEPDDEDEPEDEPAERPRRARSRRDGS